MQIELYHLESEIEEFHDACEDHAHSLHGYGDDHLIDVEENLKWTSGILISTLITSICTYYICKHLIYYMGPSFALPLSFPTHLSTYLLPT